MSEQLTLPYQPHSDTSRAAAESVPDEQVRCDRAKIYLAISNSNIGLTDEEGQRVTGIAGNTYRPRRIELYRRNKIRPDGRRNTKSGRLATIWRVTNV